LRTANTHSYDTSLAPYSKEDGYSDSTARNRIQE
jgi:hypothetical protein